MIKTKIVRNSKMTEASPNKAYTLRSIRPSVRQRYFGELDQADNPVPPNRIAVGPLVLKVVRVREYQNVIGNQRKKLKNNG